MLNLPKSLLTNIALVVSLLTTGPLQAIDIGSFRDVPAGMLRFSVRDGDARHYIGITWGGETPDEGSEGAVYKFSPQGAAEPVTGKLSDGDVERLYAAAAKLCSVYTVARSTTGDRSNDNNFQLYVGTPNDAVRLCFPANEAHAWNRGVECWTLFAEILKKDASLTLPAVKALEVKGVAVSEAGLGNIADYTSLGLSVERVNRSKTDYGTISVDWARTEDGKIKFTAKYSGRSGDSVDATPSPTQLRPLFDEIQKLAKGYRHPSFASKKKASLSREYDSINLAISATGQPGELLLPYFSIDSSGWKDGDRLWSLLLDLFPEEDQAKFIQ